MNMALLDVWFQLQQALAGSFDRFWLFAVSYPQELATDVVQMRRVELERRESVQCRPAADLDTHVRRRDGHDSRGFCDPEGLVPVFRAVLQYNTCQCMRTWSRLKAHLDQVGHAIRCKTSQAKSVVAEQHGIICLHVVVGNMQSFCID